MAPPTKSGGNPCLELEAGRTLWGSFGSWRWVLFFWVRMGLPVDFGFPIELPAGVLQQTGCRLQDPGSTLRLRPGLQKPRDHGEHWSGRFPIRPLGVSFFLGTPQN